MNACARGDVLALFAALGSNPKALLASQLPSPGEARKLMIAKALRRSLSAIVLDAPTNHLDLPTIEQLEEAISAFEGTVVIATNDNHFSYACDVHCVIPGETK